MYDCHVMNLQLGGRQVAVIGPKTTFPTLVVDRSAVFVDRPAVRLVSAFTIGRLPTCLTLTCQTYLMYLHTAYLLILLYLLNAYLSTVDLSTMTLIHAYFQPVYHKPAYHNSLYIYRQPLYRLSVLLVSCIC